MLKGTNASSGIGIGNAVIVEEKELVIKRETVRDAAAEVERFKGALDLTLKKTEELAADLATRVGEKEAEIMQGHMMLLMDPLLPEWFLPGGMRYPRSPRQAAPAAYES